MRGATTTRLAGGSLLVVCGMAILISVLALFISPRQRQVSAPPTREVLFEGEPSLFHPRAVGVAWYLGHAVLLLLAGWVFAMMVLAIGHGRPGWLLVLAIPALYLLGGPVLALTGNLRPGGVHLTPTRVINTTAGARAEMALVDIDLVVPREGHVLLSPVRPGTIHTSRVPGPWAARLRADRLLIDTLELTATPDSLAQEIRRRVAAARG